MITMNARPKYAVAGRTVMTEPNEQPADPAAVAAAFGATSAVLLGSGGYGDTYMVADVPGIGSSCAVKLLKPASYDQHRAEREMDGMRRFTGPGAARLLEVRTLDVSGEERVALVCEFIPGGNVQQRIDKGNLPNFRQLRKFAVGLLKTIAQLHGGDACHRDIKPLNILLRDGKWSQPVLIDFGMYRVITDPTITALGAHVGSWPYMPPEHLRGDLSGKAADVWACGVTLHTLATDWRRERCGWCESAPESHSDGFCRRRSRC